MRPGIIFARRWIDITIDNILGALATVIFFGYLAPEGLSAIFPFVMFLIFNVYDHNLIIKRLSSDCQVSNLFLRKR